MEKARSGNSGTAISNLPNGASSANVAANNAIFIPCCIPFPERSYFIIPFAAAQSVQVDNIPIGKIMVQYAAIKEDCFRHPTSRSDISKKTAQ